MPYKETDIKGDFDLMPTPPGLEEVQSTHNQEPKIAPETKTRFEELADRLEIQIQALNSQVSELKQLIEQKADLEEIRSQNNYVRAVVNEILDTVEKIDGKGL